MDGGTLPAGEGGGGPRRRRRGGRRGRGAAGVSPVLLSPVWESDLSEEAEEAEGEWQRMQGQAQDGDEEEEEEEEEPPVDPSLSLLQLGGKTRGDGAFFPYFSTGAAKGEPMLSREELLALFPAAAVTTAAACLQMQPLFKTPTSKLPARARVRTGWLSGGGLWGYIKPENPRAIRTETNHKASPKLHVLITILAMRGRRRGRRTFLLPSYSGANV